MEWVSERFTWTETRTNKEYAEEDGRHHRQLVPLPVLFLCKGFAQHGRRADDILGYSLLVFSRVMSWWMDVTEMVLSGYASYSRKGEARIPRRNTARLEIAVEGRIHKTYGSPTVWQTHSL